MLQCVYVCVRPWQLGIVIWLPALWPRKSRFDINGSRTGFGACLTSSLPDNLDNFLRQSEGMWSWIFTFKNEWTFTSNFWRARLVAWTGTNFPLHTFVRLVSISLISSPDEHQQSRLCGSNSLEFSLIFTFCKSGPNCRLLWTCWWCNTGREWRCTDFTLNEKSV
jgi:hypothetical protein